MVSNSDSSQIFCAEIKILQESGRVPSVPPLHYIAELAAPLLHRASISLTYRPCSRRLSKSDNGTQETRPEWLGLQIHC